MAGEVDRGVTPVDMPVSWSPGTLQVCESRNAGTEIHTK